MEDDLFEKYRKSINPFRRSQVINLDSIRYVVYTNGTVSIMETTIRQFNRDKCLNLFYPMLTEGPWVNANLSYEYSLS
jgi:hypothetical protein